MLGDEYPKFVFVNLHPHSKWNIQPLAFLRVDHYRRRETTGDGKVYPHFRDYDDSRGRFLDAKDCKSG